MTAAPSAPSTRSTPPRHPARARAGQAAVEFALVLALACLLCLPSASFVRSAIATTFLAHEAALTAPPLVAEPTATVVAK